MYTDWYYFKTYIVSGILIKTNRQCFTKLAERYNVRCLQNLDNINELYSSLSLSKEELEDINNHKIVAIVMKKDKIIESTLSAPGPYKIVEHFVDVSVIKDINKKKYKRLFNELQSMEELEILYDSPAKFAYSTTDGIYPSNTIITLNYNYSSLKDTLNITRYNSSLPL